MIYFMTGEHWNRAVHHWLGCLETSFVDSKGWDAAFSLQHQLLLLGNHHDSSLEARYEGLL